MEGNRFQSSFNDHFSRSGSEGGSTGGIEEIQTPLRAGSSSDNSQRDSPSREVREKVFVAVGKEHKESKSVLMWALQNFPRDKTFVLVHVHRPDQTIPMSTFFSLSSFSFKPPAHGAGIRADPCIT